jgi:hypothetical protein
MFPARATIIDRLRRECNALQSCLREHVGMSQFCCQDRTELLLWDFVHHDSGQMSHKFRVGQQVELVRKAAEAFPPSGPYEIVRQVPNVEGELGCHIKSAAGRLGGGRYALPAE